MIFLISRIIFSQGKYSSSDDRFELNISANYSNPEYEAYGTNVTFESYHEFVYIDGKRIVTSDNFGTNWGFGFQVYGSLRLFKQNFVKPVLNIGMTQLEGKYTNTTSIDHGVRLWSLSVGLGLEINPIGIHRFYPTILALYRFNEMGGESFYRAGVDYLIASPRFGYQTGLNLNYKFKPRFGMSLGVFYSFDNVWNRSTKEGTIYDPLGHIVNFRDEASPTNGLTHNRRIAYYSVQFGFNFYFK